MEAKRSTVGRQAFAYKSRRTTVIHNGKPYTYSGFGSSNGDTVASRLRELFAEHTLESPCELSITDLAVMFARGDRRQVTRALKLIRDTYADRLVEVPLKFGRARIGTGRYIQNPYLGVHARSSTDLVRLRDQGVDLRNRRSRARTRPPARVSHPVPTPETPPRRPARKLELPKPALDPLSIEGSVSAAIREAHGGRGLWQVLRVLREPDCHQHADAARLACRILPHREAEEPGAVFRTLFRLAKAGDEELLAEDEALRTRELERNADPWRYRPDDPSTHWNGPKNFDQLPGIRDVPYAPPILSPLERLQAAERKARLAALDPMPPPRVHTAEKAAAFLATLSPQTRAAMDSS